MGYLSCKIGSSVVTCDSQKKAMPPLRLQIFDFKELEAATGGFAVETLVGKGSHGCVYKGVLGNGMQVAVKRPSYGRRLLQDEAAFDNEIRILSKLNNPRLVRLVGFCLESKEKLLVVEFMHNGTLYDILHRGLEPLSWPKRVHLSLQTARAVLELHTICPPIIHRDIKSSNVLIDRHWNAKLGDFGLALWSHTGVSTPPAGTLGYLDPEYTTPDMLSTKNDVFSFGILLLEIISGRNAIDVQYNPPSILDWAIPLIKAGKAQALCDPRLQPPKSASALKHMAILAARCVRSKSSRRPDMNDVVEQLQEISRRICFTVFNGIARKMKREVAVLSQIDQVCREKYKAPPISHKNSSRKGCPRTPRVSRIIPGDPNADPDHIAEESEVLSSYGFCSVVSDLQTGGRCLVDLFREQTRIMSRTSPKQKPTSTKAGADKADNLQEDVEVRQRILHLEGPKEDIVALDVSDPAALASLWGATSICGATSNS